MTCVCWDGQTLAADKRCTANGTHRTVTKIRRINGCLVGVSGDFDRGLAMFEWIEQGAKPEAFPDFQKTDDFVSVLVITPACQITKYERTPYPILFEDSFFAMGSGRDFALAAMALGRTADEAVQVACQFDTGCGNGCDTLELP